MVAVRYFSKTGNTRKVAKAIAKGAGAKAVSITDEPKLKEYVDVLFLGGAPYANVMAPELKTYAFNLDPDKIGKVVLFTTSNWSRRTVLYLRKIFKAKGIEVEREYFYAHMLNVKNRLEDAKKFGRKIVEREFAD